MPEYDKFIFDGFPGLKIIKEHYINKKGEYKTKYKKTKMFSNYCFVKCKMTPEIWNTLMNNSIKLRNNVYFYCTPILELSILN